MTGTREALYRPASIALVVGALLLGAPVARADEQAQIDFANGLFARGFNDEAADEYRAYLESYPNGGHRAEALYRLGEAELALGHHPKALDAFDRLLKDFPRDALAPVAQNRKGVALYQLKRYKDAVATLSPLTKPDVAAEVRAGALYFLGKAYLDGGAYGDAADAFHRLAEQLPDSPYAAAARYQLAFAYLAQDKLEQAAVAFSELAGLANANEELRREARFRAAEAYDKLGWYDAAVKAYRQLREEFPNSDQAQRAALGHAWALYHAGKFDEAAVMARDLVEKSPDAPYAAGMQYILGNCLEQQKKNDVALAAYRQVQQRYPDSEYAARAQYKEGQLQYGAGNADKARAALTAFLDRKTKTGLEADAHYLLGMLSFRTGNMDEAAAQFKAALDTTPPGSYRTQTAYQYAVSLFKLGRYAEAEKQFATFSGEHPDHSLAVTALLQAGDAAFHAQAYDRSEGYYASALAQAEGEAREEPLYRLAVAQHNAGKPAESAQTFETLLKEFETSQYASEAHFRIGDYWLRTAHEPLKAVPHFEAAYKADPNASRAGDVLKQLALARYETKDLDGAAQTFVRVMRDWPDVALNESTYAWVGQRLFDNEAWDDAAVALRALLDHVPDYPSPEQVLLKIAECAEKAGRSDGAVERYQAVVDAAPQSSVAFEARLRMGQLLEPSQPDEAAALYKAAAEQSNGAVGARARFRLGRLYESKEQYEEAAREYMRVAILYLDPELAPEALWRAGQCFERRGSAAQARKTYEELLRDYPESEQAGKAKQRLANAAA